METLLDLVRRRAAADMADIESSLTHSHPLQGLKIFITHVKEFLVPHKTGLSARELIKRELDALEAETQLGVTFNVISPGDRVCEFIGVSTHD